MPLDMPRTLINSSMEKVAQALNIKVLRDAKLGVFVRIAGANLAAVTSRHSRVSARGRSRPCNFLCATEELELATLHTLRASSKKSEWSSLEPELRIISRIIRLRYLVGTNVASGIK